MAEAVPAGGSEPQSLPSALVAARREHRALNAADWAGAVTTAEQAYAVQEQVAATLGWFGSEPARYWKSGGASRSVTLTHAGLAPAGVRTSGANLHGYPLFTRGIEAEIALRLGSSVTPELAASLDADAAEGLVDAYAVSIEVVDSRWADVTKPDALQRLADAQSHGALVLGAWQAYAKRDWAVQGCSVNISDGRVISATGTHPMGDPAWLLPVWLRHATRLGQTLAAGTVVTTGSWVGILPVRAGDTVRVDLVGIGSAEVQL